MHLKNIVNVTFYFTSLLKYVLISLLLFVIYHQLQTTRPTDIYDIIWLCSSITFCNRQVYLCNFNFESVGSLVFFLYFPSCSISHVAASWIKLSLRHGTYGKHVSNINIGGPLYFCKEARAKNSLQWHSNWLYCFKYTYQLGKGFHD